MNGEKDRNKKIFFWILIPIIIIFVLIIIYGYSNPYKIDFKSLEIEKVPDSVNILIFGDMMLDRNVRNIIDKQGFDYFFKGIRSLVKDADIVVANLEGPFTTYKSKTIDSKNKTLQFTFDPSLVLALADFGFDILGLANNHTLNFGIEGLEMTRKYIDTSEMSYYGDPNNKKEISKVIIKNGIKVGLIGFHEFSYINFDKVFYEISYLRSQVDVLIVTPHWGIEYDKKSTKKMKEWAHQFIDLGADVVIGSHPHIIGETEEYKDKKIFYSLGNLAFDQYFSKETMDGLGVKIRVEKGKDGVRLDYTEIPILVDQKGVRVRNDVR